MRQLLFPLSVFYSFAVYAQPLSFRNEPVSQIVLESVTGFYHADRHAQIGKRDLIGIYYDSTSMLYSADVFKKGTYYTPSDKNEEPFINEMDMPGFVSMPVEAGLLMKLFNALNQSLPPDSMMMDAEIFKVLVNDSTIQLVARNLKLAEKLNGYSQKAKLIKEIIAQESFHSFLKSHMDTVCIYNMNADYWDRIMITVVTAKQSYRFEGNTKDNFRQAWYEFENKDVSKISRCVLNRNINETLLQMLPMKFNSRFFLEKRAMTESYIEWCLRSQLH